MTYYSKLIRNVLFMNNIEKIISFLADKTNSTIILPKVSEEIVVFYQLLIEKTLIKNNVNCKKISEYKNLVEFTSPSLFGEKNAYIIDTSDAKNAFKDLSIIKDKTQKFFLFVSYAVYKKNIMGSLQINTYDFKKDMNFFLNNDPTPPSWDEKHKIEFLNFSYSNPHFFFTELEKLKIIVLDLSKHEDEKQYIENIISIRKQIFKYKNEFSIKVLSKLYGLIKNEVKIKKFNF